MKQLIFSTLVFCLIVSCNKDDDSETDTKQLLKTYVDDGNEHHFTYNTDDKLIMFGELNSETTIEYNNDTLVNRIFNDSKDWEITYNDFGEISLMRHQVVLETGDTENETISISYNVLNVISEMSYSFETSSSSSVLSRDYTYNASGQVIEIIQDYTPLPVLSIFV